MEEDVKQVFIEMRDELTKLKNEMPLIEHKQYWSEDGNTWIHKTIITEFKHKNFMEKVMEGAGKPRTRKPQQQQPQPNVTEERIN